MAVSISSYISVYHSDTSLKTHEGRVKKALEMFRELYLEDSDKVRVAEHFARYLIEDNKFFAFINHNYDIIEKEFEAAFEFAKSLAYAYDDWALIVFASEVEGHEGRFLMSKKHGIIKLEDNEKFAREMEYLFTKAEFLKAKRRLEELEKERDGRE
ncbi:hypothetical protein [Thermococcus sp. ES12]|uniref:hypothetical protein n=1 Tax=Thermococcus sp. ES12 TaxID=1638246 RepID=UPI00142FA6CE|nr:hypothetical protein [Thermococcus sp. ES12]NJE75952.1 hypothetical protein [Thermococcus sp. ES12]